MAAVSWHRCVARQGRQAEGYGAESGVQSVEERVLAPLRNRQFFSLSDMNQAIRPLVAAMNQRKMQNRDHSREDLFAQLDQPVLPIAVASL